ncbi:MAG: TatD family hydrolase [Azonexus sp.]|jgi:TatD DNase family protein|uniref:TatD family hydrolase n=1 Tax=Azonexus sp. TaxID=1872668 RepID=UPI00282E1CD6|nr:TatD family hydrolase [Azonexus sp.]MDR0777307.1 TatD family hydrolase [Azonexus sp.]
MLIDSHCHLDADEFADDRDAVHAAALAGGVERMLVPAVAVGNFSAVRDCVLCYPGCVAAYGIHPLYVNNAQESDLAVLRQWLAAERPVAVGEIGLDHYVADVDPQRQEFFFVEQLKLAREFGLPVVVHARRAIDAVLKQLRRIRVPGGIAHAFNGSRQQADEFIKLGFVLGFGGAMTFSGSTHIRHLAATLPDSAIALETDAPDIPPAWLGGARNQPAELPRIAAVLAGLRGVSVAAVATMTAENIRRVVPGMNSSAG